MRKSVFLAMLLLPVSITSASVEIPPAKAIIVFPAELGEVTFRHKLHSTLEQVGGVDRVECSTCHHTYEGEGAIKPCSQCHIRGKKTAAGETPGLKRAFHYRCRTCHKYTMQQGKHAGPNMKCSLCHGNRKRQSKPLTHDDASNTPAVEEPEFDW